MEAIRGVSSACCLKTKLSVDVKVWRIWMSPQRWTVALLCGETEKNGGGKCLWQMLGCLILSHMGLNTFRTQWDSTNKQHLLSHKYIPQLLDRQRSYFHFFVKDILRWIPVVPSRCHLRLTVHRRALPAGSLDMTNLLEPVGQRLFRSFPSCRLIFHSVVKLLRPAGGAG